MKCTYSSSKQKKQKKYLLNVKCEPQFLNPETWVHRLGLGFRGESCVNFRSTLSQWPNAKWRVYNVKVCFAKPVGGTKAAFPQSLWSMRSMRDFLSPMTAAIDWLIAWKPGQNQNKTRLNCRPHTRLCKRKKNMYKLCCRPQRPLLSSATCRLAYGDFVFMTNPEDEPNSNPHNPHMTRVQCGSWICNFFICLLIAQRVCLGVADGVASSYCLALVKELHIFNL